MEGSRLANGALPIVAADLTYEQIAIGHRVEFRHHITQADVDRFAELSGDHNPLHCDASYAATTAFGRPIVHGMFLGALVSRLLGMHLPGRRCLWLSLALDFSEPAHVDEVVQVSGEVRSKHDSLQALVIQIEVLDERGRLLAKGKSTVKVI